MQLWIVGKVLHPSGREFEFEGVFDTEEAALERASISPFHWIGPVELNAQLPKESVEWPGAYYPLLEKDGEEGDLARAAVRVWAQHFDLLQRLSD